MKKPLTLPYMSVLFFSVRALATDKRTAPRNYWVAETGPYSNRYTIIRLYGNSNKALRELSMPHCIR